jgi:putative DNA primase/helicase
MLWIAYPAGAKKMNTNERFKNAMLDADVPPPEIIIADGKIHRFKINGKLSGAYVLHLDGRPAGYFQDFKKGIKQTWKQEGAFKPLTDAEKQAFAKQRQADEIKRKAEEKKRHDEAAKKAVYIWSRSTPVTDYPYTTAKGVNTHNVRCYRGSLVIPIYDDSGTLVSLQFISETGSKKFLQGGKTQGSCCFIGDSKPGKGETILIVEGWATGASLYEATGHSTVVAFSAGNLKAVAIQIRRHNPDNEIIIYGDNDESGVGQKAARDAALACGGNYRIPDQAGQDWNDVLTNSGRLQS